MTTQQQALLTTRFNGLLLALNEGMLNVEADLIKALIEEGAPDKCDYEELATHIFHRNLQVICDIYNQNRIKKQQ